MMKIWDRVEQRSSACSAWSALVFALWQVVSRYFFPQQSISYAEEVIVYLLIWAIMIVSSQLVRTDSHVRPDLVLNVVPARMARWMEVFNCLAAIVFCAALIWYGWQVVATACDRRAQRLGPALSDVDLLCGAAGRRRADARSATSSGWSGSSYRSDWNARTSRARPAATSCRHRLSAVA